MRTAFLGTAATLCLGLAVPAGAQEVVPPDANVTALTMAETGCNEPNLRQLRLLIGSSLDDEDGRERQISQNAWRLLADAQEQLRVQDFVACARAVDALAAILPGISIGTVVEGAALPSAIQEAVTTGRYEGLGVAPGEEEIVAGAYEGLGLGFEDGAALSDACQTGDFSWWRIRYAQSADQIGADFGEDTGNDDQSQLAYQLLARAQTADSFGECAQALAALEDLLPGITVGVYGDDGPVNETIIPGGVESEVVATIPGARAATPSRPVGTAGVADFGEACRTGNFAPWRFQLGALTDDDGVGDRIEQDGYRLLAAAQTGAVPCVEALAALDAILPGVTVGALTEDELTYPAGVIPGPIVSDVAVAE